MNEMSAEHAAASMSFETGAARFGVIGADLWSSFHCKAINALPAARGRVGGFVTEAIVRSIELATTDASMLTDAIDDRKATGVLVVTDEATQPGNAVTFAGASA
jgi:hypothetical protein